MSEKSELATVEESDEANIQIEPATIPETPGSAAPEKKELGVVSENHHAVQEVGASAMEKQAGKGAGKFLSEAIYDSDKAWVREWLQNHEAACIRAAKLFIKFSDEYSNDWLVMNKWVDEETGDTVVDHDDPNTMLADYSGEAKGIREIAIPRPVGEVLDAARSLGYDPTITIDNFLDEMQIVTTDNGDGMTPTEYDDYFCTLFEGLSEEDGETGGMWGVGSETSAIVHGEEGHMTVETRSRKPNADGTPRKGFRAYSSLGSGNFLPGEVPEGFFGTKFMIPVQEGFNSEKVQDWLEEYVEKVRVPVLYREHDAGTTPVEEEYEATSFIDDYNDPPVKISRPGEFSLVAGPDVYDDSFRSDDTNTFLISMPIDRNTRTSINTFWNVVIQLHDEQGLIVSGPNRGQYRANVEMQENDIAMPKPTGDRDRLSRDDDQTDFFNYIESLVTNWELGRVSEIAEKMQDVDHPANVIKEDNEEWKLFKKMVDYHGSRKVTERKSKFESFVQDRDEFPDYSDTKINQIYGLFKSVEYCSRGASRSSKKSYRTNKQVGKLLSDTKPKHVFMAASTGGNFSDYFRVVKNTYDDGEIIVVSGNSKYREWSDRFGFKVLKEVPLKKSDEHVYDIPDAVHDRATSTVSASNTGKSESVKDRALKIRTDGDNSSIDLRLSISDAKDKLENRGHLNGQSKLVLFTSERDTENISDHYSLAKYAAIASVSKKEYESLADTAGVMTYSEFIEWTESALIATEDGAMTPGALVADDRMVILCYRHTLEPGHDPVQYLTDEQMRDYFTEDIKSQISWAKELDGFDGGYMGDDKGEVFDDAKPNTLFAVAGDTVLDRTERVFDEHWESEYFNRRDITGLRLTREKYGRKKPKGFKWKSLTKNMDNYELRADTPNWDDNSAIYNSMPSHEDKDLYQMYLGFHDRGIDPSNKTSEELRELIN